jgi:glucosamine-6-phosphate deaminase
MPRITILDDGDAVGAYVASLVTEVIDDGVIGIPAGRTPRTTFDALHRDHVDLTSAQFLLMDEYVGVDVSAPHSCRGFAQREMRVPASNLRAPDPQRPDDYEAMITALGGIDVFLLAAGATDGHVGFNPPGSPLDSRTRVVELAETTRRDNLDTFPNLRSRDDVPTHGVTVGLGTIVEHADRAVLVFIGEDKRDALARTVGLTNFDPAWPASIVHRCRNAEVVADRAAAGTRDWAP